MRKEKGNYVELMHLSTATSALRVAAKMRLRFVDNHASRAARRVKWGPRWTQSRAGGSRQLHAAGGRHQDLRQAATCLLPVHAQEHAMGAVPFRSFCSARLLTTA